MQGSIKLSRHATDRARVCLPLTPHTLPAGQGPILAQMRSASSKGLLTLSLVTALAGSVFAQRPRDLELPPELELESSWAEALEWTSIGPANMSGRIAAIAVHPTDPSTYWIGSASGGILKTVNNGVSYEHLFDQESTVSIGHLAVAPSDPEVLYVGTGEANPRNSVSYGDGVYRSSDGGKTWKNVGLAETFQIGRIQVHPEDPNTVYVGALGRLWGTNEQRGLFKTTDGGKTWEKVLYIDEHTGVIDVDMHPEDPDTLVVATYERQRDIYATNDPMKKWGPGAGLWRTTDGGASWVRLTDGLPSVQIGRVGVDWCRSQPDILFAVIETERIGRLPEDAAYLGASGETADVGARLTAIIDDGPAATAGLEEDDIILRLDGESVRDWEHFVLLLRERRRGERVTLEVVREREERALDVTFGELPERDRRSREFGSLLGGQTQNVQDDQGRRAVDMGGIYKSSDAGVTWERVNSLNPRPMYFSQIRVDPSDPNHVYVAGIALYRSSDGGVTFTPDGHDDSVHVDHHEIWIDPRDGRHIMLGNDGGLYVTWDRMESWDHHNHFAIGQFYHVAIDNQDLYRVYGGLQDNGSWGAPHRTRTGGTRNEDWTFVGGGDGFLCAVDAENPNIVYYESQNGGMGSINLETNQSMLIRPSWNGQLRFHWKTPFALSHHNTRVFYAAGTVVFRSINRGSRLLPISPYLPLTDRGAATAFSESPSDPDVLYVGTDDGALWGTRRGRDGWRRLFGEPETEAGYTTLQELLAQALAGLDESGDGELALDEVPLELRALHERGDRDANGMLSHAELVELLARAPSMPSLWRETRATDAILGEWRAKVSGEGLSKEQKAFKLIVTRAAEGGFEAQLDSSLGEGPVDDLTFDPETGSVSWCYSSEGGLLVASAVLTDGELAGMIGVTGGLISLEFKAQLKQKRAARKRKLPEGKPLGELIEGPMHVATLEASRHADGRVYVAIDAHRSDDDRPYLFRSEDFGETWFALHEDLPRGSARCLREDRVNQDVLYLGTEFGAWISIDRGQSWREFGRFPTVAVHEFAQHPSSGVVVAGTHGRSLWTCDVSPLRNLTREVREESVSLMTPAPVILWRKMPDRGSPGTRGFEGGLPPKGVLISWYLAEEPDEIELVIENAGAVIAEFEETPDSEGLNFLRWDLRQTRRRDDGELRRGRTAKVGTYTAVLVVDGTRHEAPVELLADPEFEDLRVLGR